jgi:hypothetical protein
MNDMNETEYEGVTIHIPRDTILTITKGSFLFHSAASGCAYTCNKVKYKGNGNWLVMGNATEVNCRKSPKEEQP